MESFTFVSIPVKNEWRFTFTFPVIYSWHDTWITVRDGKKMPTSFAGLINVRVLFLIVYICGSENVAVYYWMSFHKFGCVY